MEIRYLNLWNDQPIHGKLFYILEDAYHVQVLMARRASCTTKTKSLLKILSKLEDNNKMERKHPRSLSNIGNSFFFAPNASPQVLMVCEIFWDVNV